MTDEEILEQAASTWAALEKHLMAQSPLPVTELDVARAGCITILIDLLRGNREIVPAELYEAEPEPGLPLIEFPKIDRRPVTWWKNPVDRTPLSWWKNPVVHNSAAEEQARWNKHLDNAVRGYAPNDSVNYEDK